MPAMVVTLEVSRLSGWLNADAPCRAGQGVHRKHVAHVRDAGGVPAGSVRVEVYQVPEEPVHRAAALRSAVRVKVAGGSKGDEGGEGGEGEGDAVARSTGSHCGGQALPRTEERAFELRSPMAYV
eukprot:scaffold36116_cov58-Phaeocystis_antarctica.AAC.11